MKHLFKKGYKMSEKTKEKIRRWRLGRPLSESHRKSLMGRVSGMKGKKHSDKTKEKMRLIAIKNGNKPPVKLGKDNHNWKGDEAGYWTLHKWIVKELGQPDTCEHCGKTGLKGRAIHWANKSHKYKRKLSDWLRLCQACHKKYDKFI